MCGWLSGLHCLHKQAQLFFVVDPNQTPRLASQKNNNIKRLQWSAAHFCFVQICFASVSRVRFFCRHFRAKTAVRVRVADCIVLERNLGGREILNSDANTIERFSVRVCP